MKIYIFNKYPFLLGYNIMDGYNCMSCLPPINTKSFMFQNHSGRFMIRVREWQPLEPPPCSRLHAGKLLQSRIGQNALFDFSEIIYYSLWMTCDLCE